MQYLYHGQVGMLFFACLGSKHINVSINKIRKMTFVFLEDHWPLAPCRNGWNWRMVSKKSTCFSHQDLDGLENRVKLSWNLSKKGRLSHYKSNEILKLHLSKLGNRKGNHDIKDKENFFLHVFISLVRWIRFIGGSKCPAPHPKKVMFLRQRKKRVIYVYGKYLTLAYISMSSQI